MTGSNQGTSYLKEFKDFLLFLQSLWGVLAGISIFFPLSNVLAKVIPLGNVHDDPAGSLAYLPPVVFTVVSTIVTLFIILSTFGQRNRLKASTEISIVKRQAWLSFGLGFLALVLYFIAYFSIPGLLYYPLGITYGDPGMIIGDIILLVCYSALFALITRAFMLMGMIEYFGRED